MTETTVSDPPPVHPFSGYQVMVNGREAEIIHLDRDELIRQLAFCIDRIEAVDLLHEQLSSEIRSFRTGEVPT